MVLFGGSEEEIIGPIFYKYEEKPIGAQSLGGLFMEVNWAFILELWAVTALEETNCEMLLSGSHQQVMPFSHANAGTRMWTHTNSMHTHAHTHSQTAADFTAP